MRAILLVINIVEFEINGGIDGWEECYCTQPYHKSNEYSTKSQSINENIAEQANLRGRDMSEYEPIRYL